MLVNPGHQGNELFFSMEGENIIFYDRPSNENVLICWPGDTTGIEFYHNNSEPLRMDDACHFAKGAGVAQRDVYHFITGAHCKRLRAGLTIHRSLASSTPHGFETRPEPGFEEFFWFKVLGNGKALIEGDGLWPDGTPVDAAWPVRDGDIVHVPMGNHRVIALPDVNGDFPSVAYVWCYLCKKQEWEK